MPLHRGLEARRAALKGNITKARKEIDAIKRKDSLGTAELNELKRLEKVMNRNLDSICSLNEKILEALETEVEADPGQSVILTNEVTNANEYVNQGYDWLDELSSVIRALEDKEASRLPPAAGSGSSGLAGQGVQPGPQYVQLPKICPPKFSGYDITEWPQFWDMFKTLVDENPSLPDAAKLQYLRDSLTGRAHHSIFNMLKGPSDYRKAIDKLQEEFGANNSQAIINSYMNKLAMVKPVSHNRDSRRLRDFYNVVTSCIRGLESLGQPTNSYGRMLLPNLLGKLPPDVRFRLIDLNDNSATSLDSMLDRLSAYIRKCELSEFCAFGGESSADRRGEARAPASVSSRSYIPKYSHAPSGNANKSPYPHYRTSSHAVELQKGRPVETAGVPQWKATVATKTSVRCAYCGEPHLSSICTVYPTRETRIALLLKEKRCLNCTSFHDISRCKSTGKCRGCQSPSHHTSICDKATPLGQGSQLHPTPASHLRSGKGTVPRTGSTLLCQVPTGASESAVQVSSVSVAPDRRSIKATAVVRASSEADESRSQMARIFLDEGSDITFITRRLVDLLHLAPIGSDVLTVTMIGGTRIESQNFPLVSVRLNNQYGRGVVVRARVVDIITERIVNGAPGVLKYFPTIPKREFADMTAFDASPVPVDLLIGVDYSGDIIKGRVESECGQYPRPSLLDTVYGYAIVGAVPMKEKPFVETVAVSFCSTLGAGASATDGQCLLSDRCLDDTVNRLFDLESVSGVDAPMCRSSDTAVSFNREKRRYEVELPFKYNISRELPNNYVSCVKQLYGLWTRLNNKNQCGAYDAVIREQLSEGIIEPVSVVNDPKSSVHYLPHLPVIKNTSDSPSLRIVYNASFKSNAANLSLNDCLFPGANLLSNLVHCILRFRTNSIGLCSDIRKAYLQLSLRNTGDRDLLRFIWVKESNKPPTSDNIVYYRFARVPFGVICSQYLLLSALEKHLGGREDNIFASKLLRGFYSDDNVNGVSSVEEGMAFYVNAKQILSECSFDLRKWVTNNSDLQSMIDECEGIPTPNRQSAKVLGLTWNLSSDTLGFNLESVFSRLGDPPTKRNVLSITSQIWDPLGILNPILLTPKLLFRSLVIEKLPWDVPLPMERIGIWQNWVSQLPKLVDFCLPRYLWLIGQATTCATDRQLELHVFSDASEVALTSVIYLKTIYDGGEVTVNYVVSKQRVAPIKKQSIPRLELTAAVMSVRLAELVRSALSDYSFQMFYYTDSLNVYYWIHSEGRAWKPYVENRIRVIYELSSPKEWFHCPGVHNVSADLITREVTTDKFLKSPEWLHGPQWLLREKNQWPLTSLSVPENFSCELKATTVVCASVDKEEFCINNIVPAAKFSFLNSLLRRTATVMMAVRKFKAKAQVVNGGPHNEGGDFVQAPYSEALMVWIKYLQSSHFGEEISALAKNKSTLRIKALGLFMDENMILRCGGRIQHSVLPDSAKHPILLPTKTHFSNLVVWHAHQSVAHGRTRDTLVQIQGTFWFTKGRQYVKGVIQKCIICKRFGGKPYYVPESPPLPPSRVSFQKDSFPWDFVGVDYLGPLEVKPDFDKTAPKPKARIKPEKAYVLVIVGAVVRCVHLELVHSMTADELCLALRKFFAQRGYPSLIISDNAKSFKLASETLKRFAESRHIQWNTIIPYSSWWAGFYEAHMGSIKTCLRKMSGHLLTFEELRVHLAEAEAIINSRPLGYVYTDDFKGCLTPAHFLIGKRLTEEPVLFGRKVIGGPISRKDVLIKRIQYMGKLKAHFWNRFNKEYVLQLREQQKRFEKNFGQPCIKTGDVVLLVDPKARYEWRMGIVEKLLYGRNDDKPRSADVRCVTADGTHATVKRSILHLIPLELNVSD